MYTYEPRHYLHPFPTRRSSDLHFTVHTRVLQCESGPAPENTEKSNVFSIETTGFCRRHHHYSRNIVSSRNGYERSEEHTSELQSRFDLVCRLLLENKKNNTFYD